MRRLAQLTARRAIATSGSTSDHAFFRRQNKALSHLIRTGRLLDARRVFDGLPQRNVITWNSMIAGYVRHRETAVARKLFDEMPHRDVISWNLMLSVYASSKDAEELEECRRLFERMPERDPVSWNTMIGGYTRNGRMEDAMRLFERMPERNVVSWNTIITGFLGIGDIESAVDMFERMPVRDSASLSTLVSGLIRNHRLEEAENVLLSNERVNAVVDAYNTLIAGYGQSGRVEEARRLFDKIPNRSFERNVEKGYKNRSFERNVISWNSMIMCYVKAGDLLSARTLFDEMPERDLVSWNTMIAGYVQALDMEKAESLFQELPDPDSRSWNSMICGFTQKGELDRATGFFKRMPEKSLVSWNTIIAGYEQNGNYEGALEFFSQMQVAGEKPDRHTLSSVLSACAGLATLRQGIQIHSLITKTIVADIPINNSLVTMYSRCGSVMDAKNIFDGMKQQKDVVSWNAMIGGLAQHGLAREALDLFKEMKRMKVRPTHITFVSVLNACGHTGLVNEGRREFDSMAREFGIMPRIEHYASLVDLIGRHGQLEDAMDVINSMVVPPDRAVWGALLGACKVHNNVELARVAAEALAEIEPESSAPYVLLYNVHMDDGRGSDALEVRESMDRNRIVKQPGYSWIELQNSVHKFVAGDTNHPFTHEIISLIESCNRIIRDLHQD